MVVSRAHVHEDMQRLAVGAYDGMLNMDWLEQFISMSCHWLKKAVTFKY